ncbi:MBL fold metallo-hydrolase [Aestuariibacter halophilus]|uniref:MBL fold metallo-hydrolase n=1 Tax=Fluctibacter halophilus TaxID=226011 RepID=A0ABS8G724_9ALTE|nr:MBL fold metallo-hydrolase [Aestuariibacter halophilus]MCC2615911.1 MBL fold metallo-hydrolase [Aestuariibacter halophilus]
MAILTFLGAAQEVTGSCHELRSPALGTVLLDCGMHQGGSNVERVQRETFDFSPAGIDAVVLSHAHLDHSGMLPKLVHDGFRGPIFCAAGTADLLEVMLKDAVSIYLGDLERENLRRGRKGKDPLEPQYGEEDVETVLSLCHSVPYETKKRVGNQAWLTFHDAGHILGSAIVELHLKEKGEDKTLVFSGDLGNRNAVLMKDPATIERADVVVMESTYGDRNHKPLPDTVAELRNIITETEARGGNIMIPAFAVGRTQELLYYLGVLHQEGILDQWQVILDSPMAIEVTKVYDKWFSALDQSDIAKAAPDAQSILDDFIPRLFLAVTPEESIAVNKIVKGALIIAGSGMCTGGRIRHHFKQRIWKAENTVLFCGYQAQDTLGRLLVDGLKKVRLYDEEYVVKAHIETLGGFSAHAGQQGLIDWVTQIKGEPTVVLVHGEAGAIEALSQKLWDVAKIRAQTPCQGKSLVF